jgi:UDP-N-acetylmuramate: L-alanyl-gamma-D-glutamyl-meso-diaminopimelate ligase
MEKGEETGKSLNTRKLIEDISQQNKPAIELPGADEIITHLLPQFRAGDVVAIMSNGGFGGIHEKLLAALKERQQ